MKSSNHAQGESHYPAYIVILCISLFMFSIAILLIDQYTEVLVNLNYLSIYDPGLSLLLGAFIICIIVYMFSDFSVFLYKKLSPSNNQIKSIDFIWYIGSALGLFLAFLNYQNDTFDKNRFMYRSVLLISHSSLREYCISNVGDCSKIDPILNLEVDEIIKIIMEKKIETTRYNSDILDIETLEKNIVSACSNRFNEDLVMLCNSLEEMTDTEYVSRYHLVKSKMSWLLIIASFLGVRISKTNIEVFHLNHPQ